MPHHQSKQQIPMGGALFTAPMMMGGYVPGRMDYRSDRMQAMPPTSAMPHPHHLGMHPWMQGGMQPSVHPSSSHDFIAMSMSSEEQPVVHRMPMVRKSRSADCTSPSTRMELRMDSSQQDDSSSKQLSSTPVSSFDSPHHMAASSVLLLSKETPSVASERSGSPSTANQSSRPLKKRKPFMAHPFPCHVSPMSSQASPETPSTVRGSYDGEESRGFKKAKTASTGTTTPPPSQVVAPHFPSILHGVLKSASSNKAIQWLEHGKAWKIVRWGALREDILPQVFPQSPDGGKSAAGSIDAFLKFLTKWGFQEITQGPDAGAYSHELFTRDQPELCLEMKVIGEAKKDKSNPRSILRVPSLATASSDGRSTTEKDRTASQDSSDSSPPPHGFVWGGRQPVFVNYRPEEMSRQGSWQSSGGMIMIPANQAVMPPYSPIRSGRGRSNFSVSNRGRRRRPSFTGQRKLPMTRPAEEKKETEGTGN